jgi:ATPase family AAA domain-containing protein 3A/B
VSYQDLTDYITWLHWAWTITYCISLAVGGIYAILTDQNKLVVAVGGATALAAGVYTTRYASSFYQGILLRYY